MQDQRDFSQEVGTRRENQMEMLKTKKIIYQRGYICSLDIKLLKETVQLKVSQEKLFSLNHKEKKILK